MNSSHRIADVFVYDEKMQIFVAEYHKNLSEFRWNFSKSETWSRFFLGTNDGFPNDFINCLICFAGIIPNFLIIYISFFSKLLVEDFRIFFGNLALAESLFSLTYLISIIHFHFLMKAFKIPLNPYMCTLSHNIPVVFISAMVPALTLTSFHRYFVVVRENSLNFSRKLIIFLCILTYYPLLQTFVVLVVHNFVVRNPYDPQCIRLALPNGALPFAILSPTLFALHFYFVFKLHFYLKKSWKNLAKTFNKEVEEVKKESQLLKAMVIQGLLPVFMLVPAILFFVVQIASGYRGSNFFSEFRIPIFGLSPQAIVLTIVRLNPVGDSITTLLVVKAYFEAMKKVLGLNKAKVTVVKPFKTAQNVADCNL